MPGILAGTSTVASQSLDRILPLWLANSCNPAMSSHFRQLSHRWNSGRKTNKGWEGEDAKAITPQTAALMVNEELKDPSSMQSFHVCWACTYMALIAGCLWTIFPNIKILNVVIPNIGIFALLLELLEYRSCPCKHWNYHVILQKIGILILSFKTLEFWPFPLKQSKTDLAPPNVGILAYILPNIVFIILSFQTLELLLSYSFLTFEFLICPLKYCLSYLTLPNIGIPALYL